VYYCIVALDYLHIVHPELLARINNPSTRDASFGAFYDALSRRVYAFALRMIGCPDTASDITQETFIRVHSHLVQGNAIEDPLPFCLMLARQRVSNMLRDRKSHVDLESQHSFVDPYSEIYATDLSAYISKVVATLPATLRESFVLRFYDGLSYDSIAELVHEKPGAVRMRVMRAKAILRGALIRVVELR
jgi:RNA polymerase sigma-70 factor, ECF subfamily